MVFSVKIWKVKLTIQFLDINPSDGDIWFSLGISWKA